MPADVGSGIAVSVHLVLGARPGSLRPGQAGCTAICGGCRTTTSAYMARGIHGQAIYIDPKAQMVVVRYTSHPIAGNAGIDPTSLPMYQALADTLMKQ